MKVLLYAEGQRFIRKSGLGKAINHQKDALEKLKIDYTINPKDDYDILHINTYMVKSYFLAKKAKRNGKKVVYHAHSTEEDFKNGFIFYKQLAPLFKKWIIKCYKLGDVIITPTIYSKKILQNYNGLENKRIYAISNGIDTSFFRKDKKIRKEFRKKYNISEEEKLIIGIGLYIKRKGIIDFVELAKRMPEYKFIWFGSSPLIFATRPVRKAVKTKLSNLLFAGYVERDEIKGAMNGCDLFLMPTLEETEGIPVVEACACKTDALIRDIPIWNGWLENGKNIYTAKNLDEFETKIKQILNEKVKSLSDKSYKIAKERDIKNIAKKLKEVYEDVLNEENK